MMIMMTMDHQPLFMNQPMADKSDSDDDVVGQLQLVNQPHILQAGG